MKTIMLGVIAAAVTFAGNAYAEGGKNINHSSSYSESNSSARANNRNSVSNNVSNNTNFQDKRQAPGFGVGGGYCANGLSVSFPGGGFGFTMMERMCKTEIGARVAKTYLGAPSAAQYVCRQSEFKMLSACRGR